MMAPKNSPRMVSVSLPPHLVVNVSVSGVSLMRETHELSGVHSNSRLFFLTLHLREENPRGKRYFLPLFSPSSPSRENDIEGYFLPSFSSASTPRNLKVPLGTLGVEAPVRINAIAIIVLCVRQIGTDACPCSEYCAMMRTALRCRSINAIAAEDKFSIIPPPHD